MKTKINYDIWDYLKPYLEEELNPCIVCGSTGFSVWAQENYLKAMRCTDCGMISVNPHFTEEGLEYLYNNYFMIRQENKLLNQQRDEMYLIDKNWVTNYIKNGRILDIGCSGGFFLSKFLNNDFELEGIEIGKDAAQFAKENFNINVHVGQVTKLDLPHKYDMVMMRGVIEHFKNPISVFKKCSEIINDKGFLFITATPAGEDAFAFDIYREKWRLFTPLEHIHFFTVKLLTRALQKLGFSYVAHHYQYTETPYAQSEKDYNKIRKDIILINSGNRDEIRESNPFPGSMITGIWQKTG